MICDDAGNHCQLSWQRSGIIPLSGCAPVFLVSLLGIFELALSLNWQNQQGVGSFLPSWWLESPQGRGWQVPAGSAGRLEQPDPDVELRGHGFGDQLFVTSKAGV